MSGMNFMEKLLDGVAVEWKSFGEVAKVQRGASPRPISKFITDDENGIHWIKIGDTSPNSKYVENTEQKITPEGATKSRILKKGDFIMSNSMSFGRPYILNIDGAIHDGWASISGFGDRLNADYLYHYLSSNLAQNHCISKINSDSVSNLNSDIIKSLAIPIPPLEIQAEIVRILDTFTELTDRKKQYNYYRDRLLSFEKGEVEWKPLGEIGEFIRGKRFTKADYVDDGIQAIHYGEIYTHYGVSASHTLSQVRAEMAASLRYAIPGDVVMAGVGETVEDVGKAVAWIGTEKVAIHDDSWAFRHSINPNFVSYVMQTTRFINEKTKHVSSGKVKRLLISGIEKVQIPIPYPNNPKKSFAEQARIVAILDKFDTLTHSISEGLPREIALRQKQYEYYRDLLLTFPKAEEQQ
jgi:type I restriction enzyme, S subunit